MHPVGGIGSGDIAAIMGLDERRGPVDVWLAKAGARRAEETEAQWAGRHLAPTIATMYEERCAASLYEATEVGQHPRHQWAIARVDRWVHRGPVPMVKCKNVGAAMAALWGADGTDEVPRSAYVQLQWQLEVWQLGAADVAALLGGTEFRVYRLARDEELGAHMLEVAERFWMDHVLPRRPPSYDTSKASAVLQALYPRNRGHMLEATLEAAGVCRRLGKVKDTIRRLKTLEERYALRLKELIGEADGVEGLCTWRAPRVGQVSWAKVAREVGAPDEVVEKYTGEPVRKLCLLGRRDD